MVQPRQGAGGRGGQRRQCAAFDSSLVEQRRYQHPCDQGRRQPAPHCRTGHPGDDKGDAEGGGEQQGHLVEVAAHGHAYAERHPAGPRVRPLERAQEQEHRQRDGRGHQGVGAAVLRPQRGRRIEREQQPRHQPREAPTGEPCCEHRCQSRRQHHADHRRDTHPQHVRACADQAVDVEPGVQEEVVRPVNGVDVTQQVSEAAQREVGGPEGVRLAAEHRPPVEPPRAEGEGHRGRDYHGRPSDDRPGDAGPAARRKLGITHA